MNRSKDFLFFPTSKATPTWRIINKNKYLQIVSKFENLRFDEIKCIEFVSRKRKERKLSTKNITDDHPFQHSFSLSLRVTNRSKDFLFFPTSKATPIRRIINKNKYLQIVSKFENLRFDEIKRIEFVSRKRKEKKLSTKNITDDHPIITHFRKTIFFPFSKENNESLQEFSFLPYFQNDTYGNSTNIFRRWTREYSKYSKGIQEEGGRIIGEDGRTALSDIR